MRPGDKVSWTHVSGGRSSISMRLREGTIERIEGDQAVVKLRSGRRATVAVARLRAEGQKSQITEFVEAMTGR